MRRAVLFGALCCVAVPFGLSRADDKDAWEKFPDGSTGKVTEYKGVKDTPIAAYVRKPKGDGPFPVVVMIHGGGESKEGTYALGRMKGAPTANFIAESWAVYSIDFRPKSPFMPIEWDDACLAVERVKKLPFIDGKRVAMIGGSHGGYNTARVASRCDLSCAIPCAPAAIDLLEVFKAKQAGFKLSPNLDRVLAQKEQEYGASMAEVMKDPAKFKHESSLTEVKNVRCPILLISGKNDASSPPSVMETYAKKLKDAGKEVELYLPDNGPHGFYFGRPAIPETDEAAKRAVAFIRKHFNPPAKDPVKPDQVSDGRKWVDRGAAEKTTAKTFRSDTIKGDVSYVIYLPPSYDKEKNRRYPVVYWLHGGRGSQRDCGKFVVVTDKAIRDGKCPEMLIVGVNGLGGNNEFPGSQYSDWKDDSLPMESVIVKDLLPHIDKTYRTLGTRAGRALEGFSMGGHGALHLAFRHPDLFGVVTAIGPALIMPGDGGKKVQWVYEKGAYKGDKEYWLTHDPLTVVEKNADKIRGKMFIRLITGEVEGNFTQRRTVELGKALEKLKIDHEFVRPGETGHNYVKVYEAMPKGYEFYVKAFANLKEPQPRSKPDKPGGSKPDPTSKPAQGQPQDRQQNQLARLEKSWVDPDKTEPAGTKYKTFTSKTIKSDVSYLIYLPPDYDKEKDRRYPVLYWLHGTGGTQSRGGEVVKRLDQAIRDGKAPPTILALVNGLRGATMYCDTKDGKWPLESVIINDLVPHIDGTYRTVAKREARAVEGFSMGGFGAAHLGFKYPEVFGVVSILAPALLGPDLKIRWQEHFSFVFSEDLDAFQANNPFQLAEKNAAKLRGRSVIRLVPHDEAGKWLIPRCKELHAVLEKHKIPHEFDVREDVKVHNYKLLYEAMGDKAFGFYAKAFSKDSTPKPRDSEPSGKQTDSGSPDPAPPVCYDITKAHPWEIGQYRVSRAAKPVEPFEIMDGLYYVGNTQVSAHLLTTKDGLVLIDSTMPHEVPWLLESIRKLGFKPSDVKVVIGTHAHVDHIGGHWYFQKHFGAQTWLQVEDAADTQSGVWKPGKLVELDGTIGTLSRAFPPFKTDRPLRDGEVVEWGGRKLRLRRAPGHTPGTLMIEFPLKDKDGKTYRAGMLGGLSPGRPEFTATCKKLRELNVEVWLGAHPIQNQTLAKADKLKAGQGDNPFIDPDGWKKFLDKMIARGK